ncbi:DUF1932 domain-containing protein [Enterovirga aerilata]|uniref:NAD(P)-dependent oxidoreductase n=1 Tax=Enterovirga aerilata TaxID=2730920 RepID=A0A849I563_9HYPH|nr:DUF1932 domain-containing protein [Enterovirga sp. DB1703]NNM71475.1 NAD(P)-dependent oxidoreductase [Enterovirga sp. DB1703]
MRAIRFAIVGFGEVGRIFTRDLRDRGAVCVGAFDIAFADAVSPQHRNAVEDGVQVFPSAREAAASADLVISCVTAGSALEAARSCAGGLAHGPFFLDVNSVSPGTKARAAAEIEAAGGRYVEAAVMTSVPPRGVASPMLLGGPHAETFGAAVTGLGMNLKVHSAEIGRASSVKMCRSVMIKGLEALVTESMLAARHYGVEEDVLASLGDTLPHPDWPGLARYVMSRALKHGRRRAKEMREVAMAVREAGIEPLLSSATAERQDWAAAKGRGIGREALRTESLAALLDALLALGEDAARPS